MFEFPPIRRGVTVRLSPTGALVKVLSISGERVQVQSLGKYCITFETDTERLQPIS